MTPIHPVMLRNFNLTCPSSRRSSIDTYLSTSPPDRGLFSKGQCEDCAFANQGPGVSSLELDAIEFN